MKPSGYFTYFTYLSILSEFSQPTYAAVFFTLTYASLERTNRHKLKISNKIPIIFSLSTTDDAALDGYSVVRWRGKRCVKRIPEGN